MANEPKVTDLIGALRALSTCLRHLACGYGRDPRERTAALALLAGRIPGVSAADLDVTWKSVARPAASAVDVEKGLASYPSGSLNVPRPRNAMPPDVPRASLNGEQVGKWAGNWPILAYLSAAWRLRLS